VPATSSGVPDTGRGSPFHPSQQRRLRTVPTAPAKPQGRRAGFCTYDDLLDNAGSASADRIFPEYHHLQVGDWMPMAKKISDTTAFKATAFETSQWLLWQKPDSTCAWKLIRLDIGRMEQSSTVWCPPGR